MNETTVTTPNELEIRVERVFDAPREHVFSVWTNPDLIPEWWGDETVVESLMQIVSSQDAELAEAAKSAVAGVPGDKINADLKSRLASAQAGASPVLIDLMERGFVSALATNGAAIIHDFEIALVGATSEDVDEALGPGRFGMAEETGRLLNAAISDGVAAGLGLGQAVTGFFAAREPQFARQSVLAAAARLRIPVTVHVAIGTDIIHMHPAASGAALGDGSLRDFRYFVSNIARLERGVFLNCGSAVVLPEVFLKAVALARNKGIALAGLTTVNLDFVRSYRPQTNVVSRPTAGGGRGYSIVGHHELMIPLLAAALNC